MNIYKHKLISRMGLMHMIATNLCVWLSVLIMETSHEIAHHTEREQMMESFDHLRAEPFTAGLGYFSFISTQILPWFLQKSSHPKIWTSLL